MWNQAISTASPAIVRPIELPDFYRSAREVPTYKVENSNWPDNACARGGHREIDRSPIIVLKSCLLRSLPQRTSEATSVIVSGCRNVIPDLSSTLTNRCFAPVTSTPSDPCPKETLAWPSSIARREGERARGRESKGVMNSRRNLLLHRRNRNRNRCLLTAEATGPLE